MLLLGSFEFQDFEIPAKIAGLLSGKQMLAVKKQIGGQRVIDAMGPDPADITWAGRFQGGDIAARAQQLASMRDAGQAVILVCDAVTLAVVIGEFSIPSYERPYQGLYDIRLIVQPPAQAAPSPTLDDAVGDDLDSVNGVMSAAPVLDAGTTVNAG